MLDYFCPNKSLSFEAIALVMTLMQLRDDKICYNFNSKNSKTGKRIDQTLFIRQNIFPQLQTLLSNPPQSGQVNSAILYENILQNDLKITLQEDKKPRRILLPFELQDNNNHGADNRSENNFWSLLITVEREKLKEILSKRG